jgi:hypothetical protein
MAHSVERRRGYRRTRRTAVVVGVALGLTVLLTQPGNASTTNADAPAAEPFSPGTGSAIALGVKVNPTFGGLSFGITAGQSVAGHQNTAATGQSQSVDLGVIGVSLAAEGCNGADPTLSAQNQPQPVVVSSDDPGAAEGKKANLANGITQFASAKKTPFATAITTVAPIGDPALALVSGSTSTATSGLVGATTRQAKAVTDIGEVKLLGGLITIGDMHWEAVQATGNGAPVNTGLFQIGSLTVAGQKLPIPADSLAQVKLLKQSLNSFGLTFDPPEVREDKGIVFVDPLRIGIVPSDLRDGLLLGPLLSALQPVREEAVKQLLRTGCGGDLSGIYVVPVSTVLTVVDLAVGSISGAGSLTLELGGVQASTAAIEGFSGLGEFTPAATLDTLPPDTPVVDTPVDSSSFDTGGTDATAGTDGSTTPPPDEVAAPTETVASVEGARGGALLGVGLGGLLLMLATAEGDRRKMRRAQREIPLEA